MSECSKISLGNRHRFPCCVETLTNIISSGAVGKQLEKVEVLKNVYVRRKKPYDSKRRKGSRISSE